MTLSSGAETLRKYLLGDVALTYTKLDDAVLGRYSLGLRPTW